MRSFSRQSEHSKAVTIAEEKIREADRHRCQYAIHGMRCTALGVICETAQWDHNVKDPYRNWLCISHYKLRGDTLGCREVIADLANNAQPTKRDWREEMLENCGLGELQSAWRDMGDDEKRSLITDTIRKSKSFVRNKFIARQDNLSSETIQISSEERSRQLEALYLAMRPDQRAKYEEGRAV